MRSILVLFAITVLSIKSFAGPPTPSGWWVDFIDRFVESRSIVGSCEVTLTYAERDEEMVRPITSKLSVTIWSDDQFDSQDCQDVADKEIARLMERDSNVREIDIASEVNFSID